MHGDRGDYTPAFRMAVTEIRSIFLILIDRCSIDEEALRAKQALQSSSGAPPVYNEHFLVADRCAIMGHRYTPYRDNEYSRPSSHQSCSRDRREHGRAPTLSAYPAHMPPVPRQEYYPQMDTSLHGHDLPVRRVDRISMLDTRTYFYTKYDALLQSVPMFRRDFVPPVQRYHQRHMTPPDMPCPHSPRRGKHSTRRFQLLYIPVRSFLSDVTSVFRAEYARHWHCMGTTRARAHTRKDCFQGQLGSSLTFKCL